MTGEFMSAALTHLNGIYIDLILNSRKFWACDQSTQTTRIAHLRNHRSRCRSEFALTTDFPFARSELLEVRLLIFVVNCPPVFKPFLGGRKAGPPRDSC